MASKDSAPTLKDLCRQISNRVNLWSELTEYIAGHYDHEPVIRQEGKDASLCIRYRRGGKTLVTLYPREGEFTVLIVLGKDEVAGAKKLKLSRNVKNTFRNAKQYHDGRWLWVHPRCKDDIDSVFSLLAVKRKPKKEE